MRPRLDSRRHAPAAPAGRPRGRSCRGGTQPRAAPTSVSRRYVGGNTGGNEVGTNRVLAWPLVSARVTAEVRCLQAIPAGNRVLAPVGRPPTEPKVQRLESSRARFGSPAQGGVSLGLDGLRTDPRVVSRSPRWQQGSGGRAQTVMTTLPRARPSLRCRIAWGLAQRQGPVDDRRDRSSRRQARAVPLASRRPRDRGTR
jgi:hypothetical protein